MQEVAFLALTRRQPMISMGPACHCAARRGSRRFLGMEFLDQVSNLLRAFIFPHDRFPRSVRGKERGVKDGNIGFIETIPLNSKDFAR